MSRDSKGRFKNDHPWIYKTDREEPLTALLNLRITGKQKEELKKVPNWQELVRSKIDMIIEENIDCT